MADESPPALRREMPDFEGEIRVGGTGGRTDETMLQYQENQLGLLRVLGLLSRGDSIGALGPPADDAVRGVRALWVGPGRNG